MIRKIYKSLLLAMPVCILALPSFAHFDAYISANIGNVAPERTIIVAPNAYIRHRNDHIYTPDRYNCYMRRTLKYCATRRGRPLNGVIVNSYDGGIAYETYQNGYQNGETSLYTQDGTLLSRSEYKKGVKHGEEIIYFYNGRVEFVMHYKDGALDGRLEQYDINGAMVGKMNYKKGWLRDAYCKNESKPGAAHERISSKRYNEVIPCGSVYEE